MAENLDPSSGIRLATVQKSNEQSKKEISKSVLKSIALLISKLLKLSFSGDYFKIDNLLLTIAFRRFSGRIS